MKAKNRRLDFMFRRMSNALQILAFKTFLGISYSWIYTHYGDYDVCFTVVELLQVLAKWLLFVLSTA